MQSTGKLLYQFVPQTNEVQNHNLIYFASSFTWCLHLVNVNPKIRIPSSLSRFKCSFSFLGLNFSSRSQTGLLLKQCISNNIHNIMIEPVLVSLKSRSFSFESLMVVDDACCVEYHSKPQFKYNQHIRHVSCTDNYYMGGYSCKNINIPLFVGLVWKLKITLHAVINFCLLQLLIMIQVPDDYDNNYSFYKTFVARGFGMYNQFLLQTIAFYLYGSNPQVISIQLL